KAEALYIGGMDARAARIDVIASAKDGPSGASFVVDGAQPTSFETGYAIWFDSNPIGDDNDTNQEAFLNFDFDADGGDSPEDFGLTNTFQTTSRPLGFTGTTADLVITFDLNASGEDIAIDNIVLTGTPIPEPAILSLVGLAGLAMLRRRA
ncbi:MAG: PEP-CTERM sorting domain-containing protein, partial [Planctomycetota bacterium]